MCAICQVREAAESSVVCQVQCQVAAAHQKLERQAAQHSSHLSEADAELQVGHLHWACEPPCLTLGKAYVLCVPGDDCSLDPNKELTFMSCTCSCMSNRRV